MILTILVTVKILQLEARACEVSQVSITGLARVSEAASPPSVSDTSTSLQEAAEVRQRLDCVQVCEELSLNGS